MPETSRFLSAVARLRPVQLLNSARVILLRDGPLPLLARLFRWLRGERRYHRRATTKVMYRQYHVAFEPNSAQLARQRAEVVAWADRPSFSIITPVFNPPLPILKQTVESVLSQTYDRWLWHLADASTDPAIWDYLSAQAKHDSRLRPIRLGENKGISENTNAALRQAEGDFVVFLDHDDTFAPMALYAVSEAIRAHPDADVLYSDYDKLNRRGQRCEPFLKPDWSPAMMLSCNLLAHLCAVRRSLLDEVGTLTPDMDGAQDWDWLFRITERTQRIVHVPQVLYHWRKSTGSTAGAVQNKPYVQRAQSAAISAHLQRAGLCEPRVQFIEEHPIHRTYPLVTWAIPDKRLISIIIPSRDHADVLARCLDSLFGLTQYAPYEVIVVDTGSTEPATQALYDRYLPDARFRLTHYREPFNFSRACNVGAQHARGDLLLFLNNDIEILHADWLERMAQWFERPDVGIVGAKLLYPEGRLQHAGVIVGLGGLAAHIFQREWENLESIAGSDCWYRDLMAVTGACLLIDRRAFEKVGGFDEDYLLNYSDIELCIQVYAAGYRVIYTPHARLIHLESISHKRRIPRHDLVRSATRWQRWLQAGDPYFHPHFSYRSNMPTLKLDDHESPLEISQDVMRRLPPKDLIVLPDDLL